MYSKTKLSNGLTLIQAPLPQTQAVTVLVLVPVGSRYERPDNNGVSHFVEHLLFKGTKRRPTSLDITKELDAVGAEYNAFTAKDHTGYYVKTIDDHAELAFDILSDMLFNATFDPQEINKERGVIVEEINMYNDNPLMNLGNIFEQTVYGTHPLGWQISGPKQVIKKISRKAIVSYKERFYRPKRMVVVVAGKFNIRTIKRLSKEYFGQKAALTPTPSLSRAKIIQTKPRLALSFKDSNQVQLGLGFPAYSLKDERIYALYLLAVILGGNMSSRLFTVVREQYGLAYYIKTDVSAYQDTGSFMVQAGLDRRRIFQAIKLILSELRRVKEQGITSDELSGAKEFLKGKIILELEDSEHVADWYGKQQLLLGRMHIPEQRIKKIMSITKGAVEKVAPELMTSAKLNLALIGPFKDKKSFKDLLKL